MNLRTLNRKLESICPGARASLEDGAVVLTGHAPSYDALLSCGFAAAKVRSRGVVNDMTCPLHDEPMRLPEISDDSLEGQRFDVVIIGAGVIGCAIAMELSHRNLSVAVLEKEYDAAVRTSGRNDGMIHPGIDLHRNQKKTLYNCRGNRMYDRLSSQLGFDFIRNGSYIIFDKSIYLLTIPLFFLRARLNGVDGIRYVSRRRLAKLQPSVAAWQKGAVFLPSSGIVRPYEVTVAFAENAAENGARFCFETAVTDMHRKDGRINDIVTNRGTVHAKVVINAAGVHSDRIAAMAGDRFFSIHPRKGTEFIMDEQSGSLTESVLARVPFSDVKQHTKGGGVVRTVDGNILVGPDAHETILREDDSTSAQNIDDIYQKHRFTVPGLDKRQIITYFSGTRACTYEEDFIVQASDRVANLVHAAGIQSPGLTAAPAIAQSIAKDVERLFLELYGFSVSVRTDAVFERKKPVRMNQLSPEERDALIKENPDYGQIVCRCEQISKGEILDVLRSSLPVYNMDAIKRRCRCGMGRCQGGFCSPQVALIIAEESGKSLADVKKGFGLFLKGTVKDSGGAARSVKGGAQSAEAAEKGAI